MNSGIGVSIICNAYNHEAYIRDALDSFVMQETNFTFEILVHDDASTDGTADIIREYELKYPNIIKPIYQTVNQYSQGIAINGEYQYPRVKGKYIAICEGDDFWTDRLKLQKQYDAMEAHPEVDLCAHAAMGVREDTKEPISKISPKSRNTIIRAEDVIEGGGAFVATCSLFYRSQLNDHMPEFRAQFGIDYTLQIHGSLRGGMLFINEYMSAYRYMSAGSWTSRGVSRSESFQTKYLNMLSTLDKDTEYKYSVSIKKAKDDRICVWGMQSASSNDSKKKFIKEHADSFKSMPRLWRMKTKIKLYFPWIAELKHQIFHTS